MLSAETEEKRSAAGRGRRARLVLNVLSLECLQDMQEAAENLSLCYCFLLASSLMNKCELYDPELYPLWPNIKNAPNQRNAAFEVRRQYQGSHFLC